MRVAIDRADKGQGPESEGFRSPQIQGPGALGNGPPSAKGRGPRLTLQKRQSITEYSPGELQSLVAWIQSDGILRTDEEILTESVDELGFDRLGSRIDAALRKAIGSWRAIEGQQRP